MSSASATSARLWPFFRWRSTLVAQRLDGGDDEDAAERGQLGEELAALQNVLDLDRRVEGDIRKLGVQRADDFQRVAAAR